jgi:hypothetical protein
VNKHDIDGEVPPGPASGTAGAQAGAPESLEQQLAKEREAKALMRDRLRHTEALAAESHALRARMAQELERVTAERDRLRTVAASAAPPAASGPAATASRPAAAPPVEPQLTPRLASANGGDWPRKPPEAPSRRGPWRALAMLGGLAAAVAAVAWITGSLPRDKDSAASSVAVLDASVAATASSAAAVPAPAVPAASVPAQSTPLAAVAPSSGAVALPPLGVNSPEAQLAAAPTAAGPVPMPSPDGIAGRLRAALDGEGIASPVSVDAATGRVTVSDPQADDALRQRTEMVIRAVYAGASLPEPQIEHRWLASRRSAQAVSMSAAPDSVPVAPVAPAAQTGPRRVFGTHHAKPGDVAETMGDADDLRPVLPAGRVTASCMETLSGKSTARRANLTACMKHSCCSSAANHNSDECRAYDRAYPFTCSAG